jgi:hypothetical protein
MSVSHSKTILNIDPGYRAYTGSCLVINQTKRIAGRAIFYPHDYIIVESAQPLLSTTAKDLLPTHAGNLLQAHLKKQAAFKAQLCSSCHPLFLDVRVSRACLLQWHLPRWEFSLSRLPFYFIKPSKMNVYENQFPLHCTAA